MTQFSDESTVPPIVRLRRALRGVVRDLRDDSKIGALVASPFNGLRKLGLPIPEFAYKHLPYRGEFQVVLLSGGKFRMRSYGGILENGLYWRGLNGYEPEWLSKWFTLARNARGVIDVGANSDLFSFLAGAAAPQARIHAFEPVARIAARLRENALLNSSVQLTIYDCAVGERSGETLLFDPGGDSPSSASIDQAFLPGRDPGHSSAQDSSYLVPVRSLDDVFFGDSMPIDLMKVGAEGVEAQVLRGATQTIARHRPTLLLEYLQLGTELDTVVGRLMSEDYRLFHSTNVGLKKVFKPTPSLGSWNELMHPREKALAISVTSDSNQ